ncbi:MAG: nitrate/nitrite transporter NrtS [Mariniphaga sp.]|nr:nitrate/nitrite transporter NrtS [Mariniphaga sp.]
MIKKYRIKKRSLLLALKIAAFVGVILNIINNPEIFSFNAAVEINYSRVILTFFVPFCVSLYSSVLADNKKCSENIIKPTQNR